MRAQLRRARAIARDLKALVLLVATGQSMRLRRAPIGLSLVYHRVGSPPGDPGRELVPALDPARFRAEMRLIKLAFRPVRASELVAAVRERGRGQRLPLAVTFDDDLGSHARTVAPILGRLGVAATFFVAGAAPDPVGPWWESLQAAVQTGAVASVLAAPDVAETVSAQWSGAPEDIHAVAAAMLDLAPAARDELSHRLAAAAIGAGREPRRDPLSEGQIAALARAGFEFGFHTLRHDYLPGLGDEALRAALRDGRAALEGLTGGTVATLAYPHGGQDQRARAQARAEGFRCAFTTQAELVRAGQDEMALGRFQSPHGSTADLARTLQDALRGARSAGS